MGAKMSLLREPKRCAALVVLATLCSMAAEPWELGRKTLVRPADRELKYKPTGSRMRADPSTHQLIEYALDGRITYNQSEGSYLLEWTGVDGQRKHLIWVPANKVSAQIAAAATYDANVHLFEYSYKISSLPKSEQRLQSVYILSEAPVLSGTNPDETWYSFPVTPYLREVFKTEDGWTWWQTEGGRPGLAPGDTAKGFRFRSSGVPTIVKCYVRGYTEPLHSSEDAPEELMEAIDLMAWRIPYGVTIGPGLPAERLSPELIAQNLSNSLKVGTEEGWIQEGPETQALKRKIKEIGHAISLGNYLNAGRLSDETTHLVNRAFDRGALLSEAQGLFAYNLATLKDKVSKADVAPPSP